MIEPTDEMIDAFNHADYSGTGNADWENEHVRIGLAAVLAIVERDWNMQSNPAPVEWRLRKRYCTCGDALRSDDGKTCAECGHRIWPHAETPS